MRSICHLTIVEQDFIPRITRESTAALEDDYNVTVVSPGVDVVKNGICYLGVQFNYTSRCKMYSLAKIIVSRGLKLDADIYQLHDPIFLLFALKLKKMGKIVVFDSHEFYGSQIKEKVYIPKSVRYLIAFLYMQFEKYICSRIDAVIQVCTIEGRDYFANRCKRSIFLENLTDLSFYNSSVGEKSDKIYVTYIGAMTHQRGITYLVDSGEYIDSKIALVGKFSPDQYYTSLRKKAGYINVEYFGFMQSDKLGTILNRTFVGISTLLDSGQYFKIDTLPTKVYEYMIYGIPVILSNSKFNCDMNEKYNFGICVDPSNSKEIAEAITYLKSNPQVAVKMGENGRKAVVTRLNWGFEKKKLLNLYKKLLANG